MGGDREGTYIYYNREGGPTTTGTWRLSGGGYHFNDEITFGGAPLEMPIEIIGTDTLNMGNAEWHRE